MAERGHSCNLLSNGGVIARPKRSDVLDYVQLARALIESPLGLGNLCTSLVRAERETDNGRGRYRGAGQSFDGKRHPVRINAECGKTETECFMTSCGDILSTRVGLQDGVIN